MPFNLDGLMALLTAIVALGLLGLAARLAFSKKGGDLKAGGAHVATALMVAFIAGIALVLASVAAYADNLVEFIFAG